MDSFDQGCRFSRWLRIPVGRLRRSIGVDQVGNIRNEQGGKAAVMRAAGAGRDPGRSDRRAVGVGGMGIPPSFRSAGSTTFHRSPVRIRPVRRPAEERPATRIRRVHQPQWNDNDGRHWGARSSRSGVPRAHSPDRGEGGRHPGRWFGGVSVVGAGCAICSDSYMGIRYYPTDHTPDQPGWSQIIVSSLEDGRLPWDNGGVASGLYVKAIEPEWFVYRFEYRE